MEWIREGDTGVGLVGEEPSLRQPILAEERIKIMIRLRLLLRK